MSPTEEGTAARPPVNPGVMLTGWGVLGWSLMPCSAGAVATALGLNGLLRPGSVPWRPGRASPHAVDAGFKALDSSPATALAFGLWIALAIAGLLLVTRCMRGSSPAVRTVGAGIGLFYFGLVGLLVTGLLG